MSRERERFDEIGEQKREISDCGIRIADCGIIKLINES